MTAEGNKSNPLKKASDQALFKELKKRPGVECLVIDDDYVLKIKRKNIDSNLGGI